MFIDHKDVVAEMNKYPLRTRLIESLAFGFLFRLMRTLFSTKNPVKIGGLYFTRARRKTT